MAQQAEQDLSDTQRDTAALSSRLLGQTFSDRYVDFCRPASGNLSLRVSVPLAPQDIPASSREVQKPAPAQGFAGFLPWRVRLAPWTMELG